jgi:adenylate cyclase
MSSKNNREIERKFLLSGLPGLPTDAPAIEIDQGYIPGDEIHERIRRSRADRRVVYHRTMKVGSGIERLEFEEETSEEFFLAVWPLTRGARVAKRRYLIPDRKVVWEIDEFVDRKGL